MDERMETGRVYLVGAGCGCADLITVRGLELLRRCQVVVYDDLIDDTLLKETPAHAERIYVGKRSGRDSALQDEICALLIRKAREGKVVIRLKGGDPYVFGRGGEEALTLKAAGVFCEEVPGISSAIAIPAAAGIPVTHRGISRSVHIITGHTADTPDGLPADMAGYAKLQGTLVFLMGLRQLPRIAARLMEAGKSPDTPAAVLSGGSAPRPMEARGTLADIALRAREARIAAPAVIVVGEVAAMDLRPVAKKRLEGVRVGLTGTAALTETLTAALADHGAGVTCLQRHEVVDCSAALDGREVFDGWLVFTSSSGVRTFFAYLSRKKRDLRCLMGCKFAVIGASTGRTLLQYGFRADLCPDTYTSRALGQALLKASEPCQPICLLRSAQATNELRQTLQEAGRQVEDLRIYDVQSARGEENHAPVDYLLFASAGAVRAYDDAFGEPCAATRCVCIGPVTAEALRERWNRPILLAPEISGGGLVQAILNDWEVK